MKNIIIILILGFLALNTSAQTYDWKRMSYSICDSSYQSVTQVTNIEKRLSNYYFAFHLDPVEIDNFPNPSYWSSGFLHPVVLTDNNLILMADTIFVDSTNLSINFYRSCIQNDTFRLIVNYPFLDSTYFADYSLYHKGLPIPKYNGFLLINYDLNGNFLGYDSLPLPHELQQYCNINSTQSAKAIHLRRVMVNSQNEIFLFLGIWSRSGATQANLSDSTAFIVKYNANSKQPERIVSIRDDYGFSNPYENMDIKMFGDKVYLFGQISDSVFVDNLLFVEDTTNGLMSYSVVFNSDLNIISFSKQPGEFYDFTVTNNGDLYYLSWFNYNVQIGLDTISPALIHYVDTSVNMAYGLVLRSNSNLQPLSYVYFSYPNLNSSFFLDNGDRIILANTYSGMDSTYEGFVYFPNNDSIPSSFVKNNNNNNLILFDKASLYPHCFYSAEWMGINNVFLQNDKFLLTYESLYYLTYFPGDNDSVFFTNYAYYTPIAIAQIDITGLGFDEMNSLQTCELALYPNPANDVLNLVFEQENEYQVQIFDISGKLVLQKELKKGENQLVVSKLKNGLYILRAQSNEAVLVGRFLRE